MDSDALATFLAIHQTGGFSSAAERLGRSQPAISRRIALLEAELGAPLFERTAGNVALSQAGQALLPHAERVLAALKDAADVLAGLQSDAGPVSLAAVGTLAGPGLTRVLKRFSARFPKADLSLRTATSAEVSDLVRRGEAAIGLRYLDDPSPDLDRRALRPEPMKVACAPGHRFAGKRVRSLRDLRSERWLAFPRNQGREASTADIFAQFLVRGVAEIGWSAVDSLTAQKRLIEAGYGIALLPESNISEELRSRSLAIITVGDLDAANPVVAITRRAGYLSPASRALLDLLEADFDGGGRRVETLRRAEGRH